MNLEIKEKFYMLYKYLHILTFLILEQAKIHHSNHGNFALGSALIQASPGRWSKRGLVWVVWDISNQNDGYLFWHWKKIICFLAFAIELFFAQNKVIFIVIKWRRVTAVEQRRQKRWDSDVCLPPLSTCFSGV